jgi:hypothetical protein
MKHQHFYKIVFLAINLLTVSNYCYGQAYLNGTRYTETYDNFSGEFVIKNSSGQVVATKKRDRFTGGYDINVYGEKSYEERVRIQEIESFNPDWALLAKAAQSKSSFLQSRFDELMHYYHETKYYLSESVYMVQCFNYDSYSRSQLLSMKLREFENDQNLVSLFSSDLTLDKNYKMCQSLITIYRDDFTKLYTESLLKKFENKAIFNNLVKLRDEYAKSLRSSNVTGDGEYSAVICLTPRGSEYIGSYGIFDKARVTVKNGIITAIKFDGMNTEKMSFDFPLQVNKGYAASMNTAFICAIFFTNLY